MKFDLLKQLVFTPSISANTEDMVKFLKEYLKEQGIVSTITDYGCLVGGNLNNPKVMISAHIDEVGFQITSVDENGSFQAMPVGLMKPEMILNSQVYVLTKNGKISGSFFSYNALKGKSPKRFEEMFLELEDNSKVETGDFGSFVPNFIESNEKIIATALDNKTGVFMLLHFLINNKDFFQDSMFAFVTEEELSYNCINGVTELYKPKFAVILDMSPVEKQSAISTKKGGGILYQMGSTIIHPIVRRKIETAELSFQKVFIDSDFPPETDAAQKNGVTKAVNLLVPMYGWHTPNYVMYKSDCEATYKLLKAVVNTFL